MTYHISETKVIFKYKVIEYNIYIYRLDSIIDRYILYYISYILY